MRSFHETLIQRRSYYDLSPESPVPDERIAEIVRFAVMHVPSAFNSQSTRAVVLLHEQHATLWRIVREVLMATVPAVAYPRMEEKINRSFASGYGTVLFFEDQTVIGKLQLTYPLYADRFSAWSEQTSAMHQLVIWTMLEEVGFGASLQHYNPLIDNRVREQWNLPDSWKLIAQMPFGKPLSLPGEKEFISVEERVKIFV